MDRRERQLRLWTVLLILNLVFIWGNSLLPGTVSGALSNGLHSLLKLLFPGIHGGQGGGSGLLRKLTHLTEFACLGVCLGRLCGLLEKPRQLQLICPFLWGVCAAFIDEGIQLLIPDRGPGLKDVGIDTIGLSVGIVLIYGLQNIKNKTNGGKSK